jgi:hypothetical protein
MPTEVSDPLSVSSQPNRAEQMQALAPSFSQVFLALGGLL